MNLTLPITAIAAAWMFMSDDLQYNTIPSYWSAINFNMVDFLFVGPAGLQADGTFGLYNSNTTGPLAHRLRWIVESARWQNPDIKIIVSQWYGSGPNVYGQDLSSLPKTQAAFDKYAASVADFIETWLPVGGGGVDGYDIDYEDGNIQYNTPGVIQTVRGQLDALSQRLTGGTRHFYTSVSPVVPTYLNRAAPYLDFVNMQTYDAGYRLTPQSFYNVGLQPSQLLYGICPESGCQTRNVTEVEDLYLSNSLAGVHLWRLNSDNYQHELATQKQIYKFMRKKHRDR